MIIIIRYGVLGQPIQLPWVLMNSVIFFAPSPGLSVKGKSGQDPLFIAIPPYRVVWGLRICLKNKQTQITCYQTGGAGGGVLTNLLKYLIFFLKISFIRTLLAINQCQKS